MSKCLSGEQLATALVERGVAVEGVTPSPHGDLVRMMNGLRVGIQPSLFPTAAQLAEVERSKAAAENPPKNASKEDLAELQTVYIRALNAIHGAYWLHYIDPEDPFNLCGYGSGNCPDRLARMIQDWEKTQTTAEAEYLKGVKIEGGVMRVEGPFAERCEKHPKQVRAVWPYVWVRHLHTVGVNKAKAGYEAAKC